MIERIDRLPFFKRCRTRFCQLKESHPRKNTVWIVNMMRPELDDLEGLMSFHTFMRQWLDYLYIDHRISERRVKGDGMVLDPCYEDEANETPLEAPWQRIW